LRRTRRLRLALGSTLAFALIAGVAGAADPAFVQAPGSPLAAQAPHSEATADLNGDGKLDLAVANFDSDSVAIFPGDGTGGFGAPSAVAVGDGPLGLAVGDLNRDGDPDLAVANSGSDSLSIHLGDGLGGFAAAGPSIALTDGPWYVSIGDLNRDGRPDVVVAHVGFGGPFVPSQHVSILLGDGDGGFTHAAGSPITVGRVPYGVEIADFNSDGNPDLAIANQFDNFVSILLGDGTGQFAPAPVSPIVVGNGPSWLVAADFNGDRNVDLAVAVSSGSIPILLGDGAGGFAHAAGSPMVFRNPHNMRAADFDRDGQLDLGVDTLWNDSFNVLLGDGDGGFQPASTTPVEDGPLSMAVGDFNDDGKPDAAVGNHFADSVSVLLNTTVTPADAIAALRQAVLGSGLATGLRTSLAAKLGLAERKAGENNDAACGALDAFVAEAQARIGSGGLTAATAQAWISEADTVRADLDCAG
jgi:hypothetical protein